MDIADIRKFVFCDAKKESDHTLINADIYVEDRKEAISAKVEENLYINRTQVVVEKYYFTTNVIPAKILHTLVQIYFN